MLRLVQVVDQAIGYVAPTPLTSDADILSDPSLAHAHHHAHQTTPSAPNLSSLYYTSTVQEKWVDHAEVYADFEREGWKREGEIAIKRANEESLKEAGATLRVVERAGDGEVAMEGP